MRYFLALLILLFPLNVIAADEEEKVCDSLDTEFKMYDCLSQHYEEAEQNMMATYKQALYNLHRDAQEDEDVKQHIKLLEDSQQNWIAYRETACMAETYDIKDETRQPMMIRLCYLRLAERRTEDIQNNFETWEDKSRRKVEVQKNK